MGLDRGTIQQAAQGLKEWFGPGQPLSPVAQLQAQGRAFDFAVGYNLQTQPKPYEGITFSDLRALADGYDLLRLVIETRKDQIEKLSWDIKKRGEKIRKKGAASDARIEKIRDFLALPDQERPFGTWIRMLCEDMLVLDAPAVYVRRTRGGDLFALETIDGATIKRILDPTGRTPLDGPAYQQVIKGVIACEYTRQELLYMPRNPRTHKAFGFGPVEQVVSTVNIALRRQYHQLSYYTDGNTTNLIFGVPKEWSPSQVKQFQEWWDGLLSGNSAMRQRARFVPGEIKPFDTKEHALKDDYDEWLARIICFAFSISPTALIKETNRATAQSVQQAALSEGLAPVMNWIKALMDRVIRDCFGASDLEFVWSDEKAMEPLVQSQRDQIDTTSGVRTVNECREDRGLEPLPEPEELPTPPPALGPTPEGANTPVPKQPEGDTNPAPQAPAAKKLAKGKKPKAIKRGRPLQRKLEAKLRKTVTTFLKGQVRAVAEAVHGGLSKMDRSEAKRILADLNIDFSALGEDVEPILAAIAQDGGIEGLRQVGKLSDELVDQVNEKAMAWAEEHAAELIKGLEDTTLVSIRGDLVASIELGMSVNEIADVLAEDYGFSDRRAELVAQTETRFADVRGNTLAYGESGVVGGLEWITANGGDDTRICPDCEMNDGQVVGMDEQGNATEPFPSGATTVPAHPGCLCDLLPVLNDDEPQEA